MGFMEWVLRCLFVGEAPGLVGGNGRQLSVEARKRPREIPGLHHFGVGRCLIVHPARPTAGHAGGCTFLLRPFGDHGFRGDQKPGDRRSILQR